MGELIAFKERPRRKTVEPAPAEGAQILFFLGVRYCRQEEDVPTKPAKSPRARRTSARSRRRA